MNLKHIARDAAYLCLGTAAVIVEAGGSAVRSLVRKGATTWHENQDSVEDLKRRAKDVYDKAREKMAAPPMPDVDASQLTPEQRAELRRQLDEADAAQPDDISYTDEPVPEEDISVEEVPAEDEAPVEDGKAVPEAPAPVYRAADVRAPFMQFPPEDMPKASILTPDEPAEDQPE